MKFACLRLAEMAAATLVSSAVLLVAITPAVFGAPARLGTIDSKYVQVQHDARLSARVESLKV